MWNRNLLNFQNISLSQELKKMAIKYENLLISIVVLLSIIAFAQGKQNSRLMLIFWKFVFNIFAHFLGTFKELVNCLRKNCFVYVARERININDCFFKYEFDDCIGAAQRAAAWFFLDLFDDSCNTEPISSLANQPFWNIIFLPISIFHLLNLWREHENLFLKNDYFNKVLNIQIFSIFFCFCFH